MCICWCVIELLSESSWTDVKRKGKVSIILQQTTKNNNNIFDPSCTNFACLVNMLKLLQNPVLQNSECEQYYMCNGRLPARCKWGLRLFGMLHIVDLLTNLRYVTPPKIDKNRKNAFFTAMCVHISYDIQKKQQLYIFI